MNRKCYMAKQEIELKEKFAKDSITIMTEMIMPNDTNPLGNLMGGNLMRWMDIVGGICAGKYCEAHVVTASVDHVSFQHPISIGNVITLTARVTRAFNTSVEVFVEVHKADITGANSMKTNQAYLSFVAVDEHSHKPIKVPKLKPVGEQELKLFESAERRREIRLILGGRLKPEDAHGIKAFFRD